MQSKTMTAAKTKKRRSEAKFPVKLYQMMEYAEQRGLDSIISWVLNGRGFMIHNPERMMEILPLFFGQTKYRSFRRQLCMWDFDRIKDGPHKGAFLHPYFVRGNAEQCYHMTRQLISKTEPTKKPTTKAPKQQPKIQREPKSVLSTDFEPPVIKSLSSDPLSTDLSFFLSKPDDNLVMPKFSSACALQLLLNDPDTKRCGSASKIESTLFSIGLDETNVGSFAGRTFFMVDDQIPNLS